LLEAEGVPTEAKMAGTRLRLPPFLRTCVTLIRPAFPHAGSHAWDHLLHFQRVRFTIGYPVVDGAYSGLV